MTRKTGSFFRIKACYFKTLYEFNKFSLETADVIQNSSKTQDVILSPALAKLELALMSSKGYDKEG